jgi:site-specific DNA-methyltransferase (adenine-specific)
MSNSINKKRAPFNRTITLTDDEIKKYKKDLINLSSGLNERQLQNKIINQDLFKALDYFPQKFVDLLFIDPPYNLRKNFNTNLFKEMDEYEYEQWLDSWLKKMIPILKPNASIYICGDWKSTNPIFNVGKKYFKVQNRITWEREKGRGAKSNWKNCSEDIWFFTMSGKYTFNIEDIKLKRKVLAPYRTGEGDPKDWEKEGNKNFRITYPSNLWNDITIPFWSMPENSDHPTQKPEKLLAKIILASSNKGEMVFDPFLGSGTTAVTAKKLGRNFCGVEIDEIFCCTALKRLEAAENDKSIQGYSGGVFWERNSLSDQMKK